MQKKKSENKTKELNKESVTLYEKPNCICILN